MPVYRRFFEAGHLQFITTSTYRRARVFSHPECCALIVHALREARAKFKFLLVGWEAGADLKGKVCASQSGGQNWTTGHSFLYRL